MGTRKQHAKVNIKDINIGFISLRVSTSVTDLGVVIDGELSMSAHVSSLTRTCFFQLRQICAVHRSLYPNSTKTLVNSFVSSRLDYCNSLLHGINASQLNKLQRVQNAAARLISGALWRDHITPVLRELHWLPVRERIRYKIATLLHKSMHNAAPYLLIGTLHRIVDSPRAPGSEVRGRTQTAGPLHSIRPIGCPSIRCLWP